MPRNDLTDVTVVLDRSGSMTSCREEAEGGLNAFVEQQKKLPGECLFTLVQFDTEYEFVHRGVPVGVVPKFTLVPRGWTALLDAVGRAINETGARLAKMEERDRPGLVAFVIVTDGQENHSREFTAARVREMVRHQSEVYGWKFTYLGANQDAFAEAGSLGIAADAAANYAGHKTHAAFAAASGNLKTAREIKTSGGVVTDFSYSDEDREKMA